MIGGGGSNIGVSSPQSSTVFRFPAPRKGIDVNVGIGEGDLTHCIYAYNMCPYEYGLRVRKGYREWQIDAETAEGLGLGIRTIIPFEGATSTTLDDRLFSVTNEGIWDTTIDGDTPVLKFAFADTTDEAGYGSYTHYVTEAGLEILYYADSKNGLFEYTAASDMWVQATGITGPVITDIRFIVVHKQRIWFIEEDSTKAWYLPVGSKQGTATEFFFGSKFKHGGVLLGLFNWSVDGGAGLDDILVAVSQSGDVIPYKGDDPSSAAVWTSIGTYFIGQVPRGPYIATEHGGELFLLSTYGVIGMSDLLTGVDSNAMQSGIRGGSVSARISAFLRLKMTKTIDKAGWEAKLIPSEGGFLISSPTDGTEAPIQYFYNIAADGWSMWRDVPMTCFDTWKGQVVFGSEDNRVLRMDVNVDNKLLTPPVDDVNGADIEFSLTTSYSGMEKEALYKRVKLIRPDVISELPPILTSIALYDYQVAEPIIHPSSSEVVIDLGAWDEAIWGTSTWGSTSLFNFSKVTGGWGPGRYVAIGTRGLSRSVTRLAGWDIIYDVGGPMY